MEILVCSNGSITPVIALIRCILSFHENRLSLLLLLTMRWTMKTLTFSNGDQMPMLGLGTWKSDNPTIKPVINQAINIGYRHLDCAAVYGNEVGIGEALADVFKARQVTREALWITSKLWNNAHKADDVLPVLKKTLHSLQLDYLDLYLIHWPVAVKPEVGFPQSDDDYLSLEQLPIIETWQAMEACVDAGLIKHIGVSNFSIPKLKDLVALGRIKPEMNQVELHPLLQQDDLKNYCDSENIKLTAYAPLGSADRPAFFLEKNSPAPLELSVIKQIASAHNATAAQVLLAWGIQRGTAVIPKSVKTHRLEENFAAKDLCLTDQEMAEIKSLDQHYRLLNGKIWEGPYTYEYLWDEKE